MLSKDIQIAVSYHPADKISVQPALEQVMAAGWHHIVVTDNLINETGVSEVIRLSDMFIVFLSRFYAQDDRLMLEEFAYASTIERKHFIPVWIDELSVIQNGFIGDPQLLSALEMLTSKYTGVDVRGLIGALVSFMPFKPEYTPSTPQICEKPCEAYEGDEPYIFISYAHDDAKRVYPVVKELHEDGWDVWYDEGIKTTQRYLPVIADHVKR